jgi:hypothetical protein
LDIRLLLELRELCGDLMMAVNEVSIAVIVNEDVLSSKSLGA